MGVNSNPLGEVAILRNGFPRAVGLRLVKDWFDLHNKEVIFFTDSQNVVSVVSVYSNIHSITFFFRNNFFSTTFKNKYTPLYIYTYIYFIYIFLYIYIYIYKRI